MDVFKSFVSQMQNGGRGNMGAEWWLKYMTQERKDSHFEVLRLLLSQIDHIMFLEMLTHASVHSLHTHIVLHTLPNNMVLHTLCYHMNFHSLHFLLMFPSPTWPVVRYDLKHSLLKHSPFSHNALNHSPFSHKKRTTLSEQIL